MNEIQHVTFDGKKYVIIPEEKYEQLSELIEMQIDLEAIHKYEQENPETFPAEVINKILLKKENPLKVFREYRGLTQASLASKCGVTTSTIAQIETNKRQGTVKVLSKIAQVLELTIEDIIDIS